MCKEDVSAAEILVIQGLFLFATLKFANLCQEQEMKMFLLGRDFL
jgi:hypothetical protein